MGVDAIEFDFIEKACCSFPKNGVISTFSRPIFRSPELIVCAGAEIVPNAKLLKICYVIEHQMCYVFQEKAKTTYFRTGAAEIVASANFFCTGCLSLLSSIAFSILLVFAASDS